MLPLGLAHDYTPIVLASFAACWLVFGSSYATFSQLEKKQRVQAAQHVAGLLHAIAVCAQVGYFLSSAEAEPLRKDLYGSSAVAQRACAVSVGFFLYDIAWGVIEANWQYLLHGGLCSLIFIFCLHPFLLYIGSIMLAFELSSIPYNIRMLMIQFGAGRGALYDLVQVAFALSFLGVRLGVGLPASFYWWLDMLDLLRSGKAHSTHICYFFLTANLLLNGLNLFWARGIVNKILRALGAPAKPKAT